MPSPIVGRAALIVWYRLTLALCVGALLVLGLDTTGTTRTTRTTDTNQPAATTGQTASQQSQPVPDSPAV